MNLKLLWKPFLLYTGLLGLLTVGAVYLATQSGLYMLVLAGGGLVLVALGGGATGKAGGIDIEYTHDEGDPERTAPNSGLWSPMNTETPLRLNLLFYGFGVFLWSLVVLSTLRDTLV